MAEVRTRTPLLLLFGLIALLGLTAGCGSDDESPAGIDTAPPAVPTGVDAKVIVGGNTQIVVSWDANVTDADLAGYMVYRSHSPSGSFEPVGAMIDTNSWTDTSVEEGGTYYYRVAARDVNANESALSSETELTVTGLNEPVRIRHEDNQ